MKKSESVDRYIEGFPPATRKALKQVRAAIIKAAPSAVESIAYGLAAYKLADRPLVYFGGFAKHVGFYATPGGHTRFSSELAAYKQGRGSVQFPLTEPMPVDLIARMVRYRVKENLDRVAEKSARSRKVTKKPVKARRRTAR